MVELISTPLPFSSITNQFFVLVGTFLVVFYLQFLWGRRKLYKYAFQVDGPFSFPFIGSALHFLTTRSKFSQKIILGIKGNFSVVILRYNGSFNGNG